MPQTSSTVNRCGLSGGVTRVNGCVRAACSSGTKGQLGDVLNRDLGTFNDMLRRANLPTVVTQAARKPSSQ